MGSSGKGRGRGATQSSGSFFGGGGYASHGEYMVEKNRKLKEQFAAAAQCSLSSATPGEEIAKPAIFKGCSFWMTGRTCIPDQELKRLIVEHGGVYEQYGFTRVSHVIADNLAAGNQTWGELKRRLKRCNVVISSWITDSIREGKRVPETRYMPKCLQAASSMLSFMGQNSAKRVAGESVGGESCGAAERIERLGHEAHGEARNLPSSVTADTTPPRDIGYMPRQAHATSPVCVESQYGGDIEEPQLQQTDLQRRCLSPPLAASSAASSSRPAASKRSVAVDAGKQLHSGLNHRADATLGKSVAEAPPAVVPRDSSRAPSALALEISASCPDGLRGCLSELHALLAELGKNANEQLKDAQRPALAVGLQISVEEPCLHEWSSTADLPAGPIDAEELIFALKCLAGRAVITLGLVNPAQASSSSSGPLPTSVEEQLNEAIEGSGLLAWTTIRRIAIQVRCGPVPTDRLQPSAGSTLTAANMSTKDDSLRLAPPDSLSEVNSNRPGKTDAGSIEHNLNCLETRNDFSGGQAIDGNHNDIPGANRNNNSIERSTCRPNHCSDIAEIRDCSDSPICETDEVIACSSSPVRFHRSKRPRWKGLPGFVSTDMSTEQLVDFWRASCQTYLGIAPNQPRNLSSSSRAGDNSAETARTASLSCHVEAFQMLVAKHELDVAVSALRALQAAAEYEVVSTLHVDGLPPHLCFNMLLSRVQRVMSKATGGARLHIQPLPQKI